MTYFSWSSFVKRDYELLNNDYQIITLHFNVSDKLLLPFAFLKQAFLLIKYFKKYHIIISQSAGYISFFPSLFNRFFNKKLIIIAIGTDCVSFPELNYGAFNKKLLGWFTAYTYRNASLILPVHKSLVFQNYNYTHIRYQEQGIMAFVKNLKTTIIAVNNGFDSNFWRITNFERQPFTFLTVTTALSETGYYLKGIDLIIDLAFEFPNYKFTIIGNVLLKEDKPKNLTIVKNVPQENLLAIYNQHQYYLQLSMSEGFPNALGEAMLCGCIPIGSNVAAIPEIIGNYGIVIPMKEKNSINQVFKQLQFKNFNLTEIRQHIINNFSLDQRKKELLNAISKPL